MAYQALYRKYRPTNFDEVVGQTHIIQTLKNAIVQNRIAHAYLFCGPRGTGKTSIAKIFAKTLNCTNSQDAPCGVCENCKMAANGSHPDIIEIDAASNNGVDEVRNLIDKVKYAPMQGKYKIYIVPDAEKMTAAAQNALLKTIEEPPAYAVILLLANNASALLPTILSRCVMLSLKPVADDKVKQYLMEHVQVPDYEADVCVAFAQGNIGKAVQLATSDSFNEIKNSALHLLKNVSKMEINDIIATVKSVSEFKIDIQDYLDFLAVWYRDILYFKGGWCL